MTTLLGIYAGSDPKNVTEFEAWLGRKVDFYSVHTSEASWAEFDSGVPYQRDQFADLPRMMIWSVPLIPAGATLPEAARGGYNTHYTRAAATIAAGRSEPVIYVRTGWEHNGDWMKWAAKGQEAAFIAAFQQFTACFRAVSPRFRLVWCPVIGQNDPALTYPGDRHVDVIGLDVYHNPQWDPKEPKAAWVYMVTRPYGLQWHLEFSRTHAKPMAYPEWGVSSDGFGSYIANMAEWFRMSGVLYQAYWESNADYRGMMGSGQYPSTAAAFRRAFG